MLECLTPKLCTPSLRVKSLLVRPRVNSLPNANIFTKNPAPQTPIQVIANLITFHWVGGDKNAFRPFARDWEAAGICVWSFVLPGRTVASAKDFSIDEYASMFIDNLKVFTMKASPPESSKPVNHPVFPHSVPLILLGHSLGGILAYESARRLSLEKAKFASHGIHLNHLIISSIQTPSILTRMNVNDAKKTTYHTLDENDLLNHIRKLGGMPPGVDTGFIIAKMSVIRSDFSTYHSYTKYRAVKFIEVHTLDSGKSMNTRPHEMLLPDRVDCDITSFAGATDTMVDALTMMATWHEHTTGDHVHINFSGSHFYLLEEECKERFMSQVVSIVAACHARYHPSTLITASTSTPEEKGKVDEFVCETKVSSDDSESTALPNSCKETPTEAVSEVKVGSFFAALKFT
jgi:surfactin synthase thioesterase subunit